VRPASSLSPPLACLRLLLADIVLTRHLTARRLDCTKRWTAQECLEHPFFRGTYDLGLGRTVFRESGYEENMTSP